jgi:hypothetical protein
MERAVAKRVVDCLVSADGALQDAVRALKEEGDASDVAETKRRIATIIALIGSGLYHPIYHEHPELCPEGLQFMKERPPAPRDWPFA